MHACTLIIKVLCYVLSAIFRIDKYGSQPRFEWDQPSASAWHNVLANEWPDLGTIFNEKSTVCAWDNVLTKDGKSLFPTSPPPPPAPQHRQHGRHL